jgi:potassium efflux system protein
VAALAGASIAQPPGAPGTAAANAEIADRIADTGTALERASAELEGLRAAKRNLEEDLKRIESRAAVYAAGREFARTLIEQRARLPRPEDFTAAREERALLLNATSDANIRAERMLGRLRSPDAAADPELTGRRDLTRLADAQYRLLLVLKETEEAAQDLERQAEATHERLSQLLFWVPAPPKLQTLASLGPSLAWTFSLANWRGAIAVLWEELARRPFWPAIALLAAAVFIALRHRLHGTLVTLGPAAVGYGSYRIRHALAALGITFALALPGPILLWTVASLLGAAPDSQPFTLALGDSLGRIARLVLALSAFAWLMDRRAMAVGHFGWNEEVTIFGSSGTRVGRFGGLIGLEAAPALAFRHFKGASDLA